MDGAEFGPNKSAAAGVRVNARKGTNISIVRSREWCTFASFENVVIAVRL